MAVLAAPQVARQVPPAGGAPSPADVEAQPSQGEAEQRADLHAHQGKRQVALLWLKTVVGRPAHIWQARCTWCLARNHHWQANRRGQEASGRWSRARSRQTRRWSHCCLSTSSILKLRLQFNCCRLGSCLIGLSSRVHLHSSCGLCVPGMARLVLICWLLRPQARSLLGCRRHPGHIRHRIHGGQLLNGSIRQLPGSV